jgi:hypothetical protein
VNHRRTVRLGSAGCTEQDPVGRVPWAALHAANAERETSIQVHQGVVRQLAATRVQLPHNAAERAKPVLELKSTGSRRSTRSNPVRGHSERFNLGRRALCSLDVEVLLASSGS